MFFFFLSRQKKNIMKQNRFIQNCMQSYMKNYQHYLTGAKRLLLNKEQNFCNISYSHVAYELWGTSTNPLLSIIIGMQCTQRPEATRSSFTAIASSMHTLRTIALNFRPAKSFNHTISGTPYLGHPLEIQVNS